MKLVWLQETNAGKPGNKRQKVTDPVFSMADFLRGRENLEAYSTFFDLFLPCATKKTTWLHRIAVATTGGVPIASKALCTVSDEAFALLLLENSYERWLDIHRQSKGAAPVHRQRLNMVRVFESNVPPLYTSGGIKYSNDVAVDRKKGWSAAGMSRFNTLFDQVRKDRKQHRAFESNWLDARRIELASTIPKKAKRIAVVTRSELFESSDDEKDDAAKTEMKESNADGASDDDSDCCG